MTAEVLVMVACIGTEERIGREGLALSLPSLLLRDDERNVNHESESEN